MPLIDEHRRQRSNFIEFRGPAFGDNAKTKVALSGEEM